MYKIEAFLRPAALQKVQEAMQNVGHAGMSVLEVRGFGRQRGHREVYRGAEYTVDFVPKIKIEIAASESDRDKIVEALIEAAKTGNVGDGKVFILPLTDAVRIRTGETGESAL